MSRLGFRRSLSRLIASVGALVLISSGVVAVSTLADAPAAQAADLTQFKPGNIISDALFWNSNAMTAAQIQSFLNDKVPTCRSGYVCLKDYRETTWTSTANPMCSSYAGAANESAATIIDKVARACGVSQKVLLVMLQKEQGLVTHTWPSTWRYTAAMGAGCPDTAACDSDYYGFYNQVRYGAYLLKRYTQPSGTGPGTWWDTRFDLMKPVGRVSSILYSPNTACGTRDVYIENQATHALYLYTPYTPNDAALAAGYSTGDGCSAYGNRNFFNYYTDWFGPTNATPPVVTAHPVIPGTPRVGTSITGTAGTYTGIPVPTVSLQWARCTATKVATTTLPATCTEIAGATSATYAVTAADAGKFLSLRSTATNSQGSYTSWSASSAAVTEIPSVTTDPALSGSNRVGSSASVSAGVWRGSPAPTIAYAWFTCSASVPITGPAVPSTCVDVPATSSSVTWSAAHVGKFGAVKVTATNAAGATSRWITLASPIAPASSPTATPTPTATPSPSRTPTPTATPSRTPTPTATPTRIPTPGTTPTPTPTVPVDPTVSGVPAVGGTLTVNPGSWAASNVYQNTGPQYNGFYVRNIQVALTLGGIPTTVDGIYGAQTTGNVKTFQAAKGLQADGITGPITYAVMDRILVSAASLSYSWFVCSSAVPVATVALPPSCAAMSPAVTSTTFTPAVSHAGKFLSVRVTGSRAGVNSTLFTAAPTAVGTAPSNTTSPTVSGTARVGSTLTSVAGTWSGSPTPSVGTTWVRCSAAQSSSRTTLATGCATIPGATSGTYAVTSADLGAFIAVGETATNTVSTTTVFSPTTAAIASAPSPTPTPGATSTPTPTTPAVSDPMVSGTPKVGSTLTASTGTWTPVSPYQDFGPTFSGYYVRNIQTALKGAGISVVVDGIYGPNTRAAVTTFQTNKGLTVDGIVGPQTWNAMVTVLTNMTKFDYVWYACSAPVASATATIPSTCAVIPGATTSTYRPVVTDTGKFVSAAVTGTRAGTVTTSLLASVTPIAP